MAILLSSHLLNQVQSVCDRIGIFAAGRLIGQGTLPQLAARFGDGRTQLEVGLDITDDDVADAAGTLLAGVAGVESVAAGTGPTDPWSITIRSADEMASVRSAVLAAVAQHGLPLTSIRPIVPSLEEIYRRAVARPAEAHPGAVHAAEVRS
jgi:ABC-2 type transport system ATP-binding protein